MRTGNTLNITDTTVNGKGALPGGQALAVGTTITLVRNTNGLTIGQSTLGNMTVKQGISLDHTFSLTGNTDNISAVLTETRLEPATSIFTNGRLVIVSFLNEGSSFALDIGMMKILDTVHTRGVGVYGAISGSDMRHNFDKRGDADITGIHWLLGIAGKLNLAKEYDLIGSIYTEAGWGNLDSDNNFSREHGGTHYYGIGLIGRY